MDSFPADLVQGVHPGSGVRDAGSEQREGSAPLGFPQHHFSLLFPSQVGGQERKSALSCSQGSYPALCCCCQYEVAALSSFWGT